MEYSLRPPEQIEEFEDKVSSLINPEILIVERTITAVKTAGNGSCFVLENKENPSSNEKKDATNMKFIMYELIGFKEKSSKNGTGTFILLGVMLLLFLISITGFFVMWFTEYYNNSMLENIILAKNSETAQQWINPNPKYDTFLKVHIFNYTNIERYLSGKDNKIKVTDLGPLTYQEHTSKVDVSFNDNYTVTFRDHRSYKFLPEKSNFNEIDEIVVPNVPLLSADKKIDKLSLIKRMIANAAINGFNEPAFKKLTAQEFLWGYPDKIIRLDIGTGDNNFGLLMNRNGTSVDSLQINTGEDDIGKFGTITQFNGMPHLDYWSKSQCNSINGSDPAMFSPYMLQSRQNLFVFLQVLCRKIPLAFEKEVVILNNIDALRYKTPLNVFSHPHENPENMCYCENTDSCLPSGVINATRCYNGAPIYPSFPHFFSGNPIIYEELEGITPDASKHQTYADIHPRFGFPINGASRIQINIVVHKGSLVKNKITRIKKRTILPLIWIEITSGDFTEEIIDKLYISTFGLNAIQFALKYGTLLICVTSFGLIVAVFYTLSKKKEDSRIDDETTSSENLESIPPIVYQPKISNSKEDQ